jgi:hypothetical protein
VDYTVAETCERRLGASRPRFGVYLARVSNASCGTRRPPLTRRMKRAGIVGGPIR